MGRDRRDSHAHDPLRRAIRGERSGVPGLRGTELALRSLNDGRSERERKEHNAAQARARIAARKAESEQKFRGIKPE
jgi:hypothetical protein